jgi:hypothetical protein
LFATIISKSNNQSHRIDNVKGFVGGQTMSNRSDFLRGSGNNEIPPAILRRGSIDSDNETIQQELPSRTIVDDNWRDKYHQVATSLNSIQLSIRNNNSSTSFSRNGSITSKNLHAAFNESYLSFIPVGNNSSSEIVNDSTSSILQTQSRQSMNRRPSVFTTLSGSRFYMDDKKGEPVPFLPSNRGVVNTSHEPFATSKTSAATANSNLQRQQHHDDKGIPMQDDSIRSQQIHTINRHNKPPRRASNDDGAMNHNRIGDASMPILLPNISENGPPLALARREHVILSSSQLEPPRQIQKHSHHRHPPLATPGQPIQLTHQNNRQPQQQLHHHNHHNAYHRSTHQLKSVIMMERIPPPIPSMLTLQQQRSSETKMSNDFDIIVQLSTRCLQPPKQCPASSGISANNNDKNESTFRYNSTFTVGIPISTDESTRNRFPYHCFILSCHQCYTPMMVSKYSIAVQCPECQTIGPSESSLSNAKKATVKLKQSKVAITHRI